MIFMYKDSYVILHKEDCLHTFSRSVVFGIATNVRLDSLVIEPFFSKNEGDYLLLFKKRGCRRMLNLRSIVGLRLGANVYAY